MIPLQNKELLIQKLESGMNLIDACTSAKVSRASLYRLFKAQPGLKTLIDTVIENTKKKTEQDNLNHLKKLVSKR